MPPQHAPLLLLLICLHLPLGTQTEPSLVQTGPDGVPRRWATCRWCCSPEHVLPVTPELAGQAPRRLLVLLRGISYSSEYRKGAYDYRRARDNFSSHVVEPLRAKGHTVDVAISTYNSSMLADVQRTYGPAFSHVARRPRELTIMVGRGRGKTTKLDLTLAGLEAAERNLEWGRWDAVVLTRFDLEMREPITSFAIDFDRLNFPWKERPPNGELWEELPRVGDALQVIPARFLQAYVEALRRMVKAARDRPGIKGISLNNGHRILMNMEGVDIRRDVQLLSTETCRSDFRKVNPFYREAVSDELLRFQPLAWVPMPRWRNRLRRKRDVPPSQ